MLQPLWRFVLPKKGPIVHAVHLRGVIASRAGGPRGIAFASIKDQLEAAFKGAPHPPTAVALVVNSPGGSPVQSALIGQYIDDLAGKTSIPVLAFAEDVAASGGYWLLCSGQQTYCNPASIVGSIGAVSGGFGLHQLMERYGVERRVFSAGEHKVRLDPFLPQQPDDVAKMKAALAKIHGVFQAHVRSKRGKKIEGKEATVFSGDFWVGTEAVELGLVDKIGSMHTVVKEKFGPDVVVRDMKPRPAFPFLPSWFGSGTSGAVAMLADEMEDRLTERVLRARVGLD